MLPKPIAQKKFRLTSVQETFVYLKDVWHPTLNPSLEECNELGTQSVQPIYLYRVCKRHVSLATIKSFMNTESTSWYNCKICCKYQDKRNLIPKSSKVEKKVFKIVNSELDLQDDEWVTDAKPLYDGSSTGSVDIYVPKLKLVVLIDGDSHFRNKYNIDKCKQRQIDERFNMAAIKQFHVIRLHHEDYATLGACWKFVCARRKEFNEIMGKNEHKVLHYSVSYYALNLVDESVRDELEDSQYDKT